LKNLLILPLYIVLTFLFVVPISSMLISGVYNTKIEQGLPNVTYAIKHDHDYYEALYIDLQSESSRIVVNYLNHYYTGARSLITKTKKNIEDLEPLKESFVKFDQRWEDPKLWEVIEYETNAFTVKNYQKIFSSLDSIYLKILIHTIFLSILITLITLLLALPVAYFLTTIKNRFLFHISILTILLPFFTSYLSRLVAWLVLLQSNGLINQTLGTNFELMNNILGIFIGSVYILIPMAVLPLYITLKNINYELLQSAEILGANKIQIFFRIYIPLIKKGIINAFILVFMTVIGFYTTPALLGGNKGKFITEQIVYHMEISLNWGLANALTGTMLLILLMSFIILLFVNKGKIDNV